MSRPSRRLPVENTAAALHGFKLAQLLLAADGSAVAFSGLSIGSQRVYRAVDEAVCIFSPKHSVPDRRGDCGFYCVNTAEAARALASDTAYRNSVLLEVAASGRYFRYEDGLRYQRQRVRAVRIGLCDCGRLAEGFVDAGQGVVGWRRILPVCEVCAGLRPRVPPARIGALLPGIPVGRDAGARPIDEPLAAPGAWEETGDAKVALLSAEVTLLQARLDAVQSRLSDLDGSGGHRRNGTAD